mmetsp:Transcript_12289/g.50634  ORF Transcript_12289/g.50634 Transcript_12289/m.50634 type:complete len:239 (-) Transcript_12289:115-831(-)|eukprot:CAMPEP_0113962966 /NCGR_PEP_ID=MMETSP0011_2-20120614/6235_1 /TAXON_ID=101924 /ORGANISM="Rhodosorus marinus" /LENGTH=238 /DNA_ID=CAMNT_0000974931 /DNA_START=112 /DNA_END=828 /DNA_ORIENTATION=- /assembly_acc=CAM_ASM_000156
MGMITNLKRSVQRKVNGPAPTGNSDIDEYVQRLCNISSALEESSNSIIWSQQQWAKLYRGIKFQFENFANVYPDDDEYRQVFKQGSEHCNNIAKTYSNEDLTLPGRRMDFKVQEYLVEINAVLKESKYLEEAYANYKAGVEKISHLERAKRVDHEKIARFEESTEVLRKNYIAMSDSLLTKMKRVYSKRKIMFNTAYVAYWRSQMTFISMLEEETKETKEYVMKHEKEYLNMDVSKLC